MNPFFDSRVEESSYQPMHSFAWNSVEEWEKALKTCTDRAEHIEVMRAYAEWSRVQGG